MIFSLLFLFFFFKQKTAYEMRISDWSSDGALPILATVIAGAGRQHFHRPATVFGVFGVHPEQVAGKDRGLVTAGTGPHFQEQADRKSTRLNSSHSCASRMPSSA